MDGSHDVLVEFGLCPKDSDEATVVVDEDDCLCVASSRGRREELEVKEYTLSYEGGWGRGAGDVKIVIVGFTNLARTESSESHQQLSGEKIV